MPLWSRLFIIVIVMIFKGYALFIDTIIISRNKSWNNRTQKVYNIRICRITGELLQTAVFYRWIKARRIGSMKPVTNCLNVTQTHHPVSKILNSNVFDFPKQYCFILSRTVLSIIDGCIFYVFFLLVNVVTLLLLNT